MKKLVLALVAVLALGACASSPSLSTPDRLALYQSHAGEPVMSFRLDRNFRWTPLGDQALAVWTGANQGHLLELRSRCSGLGFASSIHITNSMGQVTARFDSVQPRTGMSNNPQQLCRIWSIRPLDVRALNDEKRELRDAETIERAADVVEEKE